jgi:hypothetical protein
VVARWPNQDPIHEAGGINLFAFVDNQPINKIDLRGLQSNVISIPQMIASGFTAEEIAMIAGIPVAAAAGMIAAHELEQCEAKKKEEEEKARVAKEEERVKKCNAIWLAQEKVCEQLFTKAARRRCFRQNDKFLDACLRNKGGKYSFD